MSEVSGRDLESLLVELVNYLKAPATDSTPSDVSVASRLQDVLSSAIAACIKTSKAREKWLDKLLTLMSIALEKCTVAFSANHCFFALSMITQLVPLFGSSKLRQKHVPLLQTVQMLVVFIQKQSQLAYLAVLQGFCDLTSDCAVVHLACWGANHRVEFPISVTALGAVQALRQDGQEASMEAALQSPIRIELHSITDGQLLASAVLQVVSFMTITTPSAVRQRLLSSSLLSEVCCLMSWGFTVQTACLDALAGAISVVPLHAQHCVLILERVVEAVKLWCEIGPSAHPLLPTWKTRLLLCLKQLAEMVPGKAGALLLECPIVADKELQAAIFRLQCSAARRHSSPALPGGHQVAAALLLLQDGESLWEFLGLVVCAHAAAEKTASRASAVV